MKKSWWVALLATALMSALAPLTRGLYAEGDPNAQSYKKGAESALPSGVEV